MTLPYVQTPRLGFAVQPYGLLMLAAVVASVLAAIALGRKRGLSSVDLGVLLPVAAGAAVIGAHVFDMVAYQLDDAIARPELWFRVFDGVSLFGAIAGVACATWLVGFARRLELGVVADVMAVAMLIAMTIGRVGCALVHDHLGGPTSSPFGVEFPATALKYTRVHVPHGVVVLRIHDVGLEELLVLLPILGVCLVLVGRKPRAGTVAVVAALAYAVARFALDFLRSPATEPPSALGLTVGQWSCIGLAIFAALGLKKVAR